MKIQNDRFHAEQWQLFNEITQCCRFKSVIIRVASMYLNVKRSDQSKYTVPSYQRNVILGMLADEISARKNAIYPAPSSPHLLFDAHL